MLTDWGPSTARDPSSEKDLGYPTAAGDAVTTTSAVSAGDSGGSNIRTVGDVSMDDGSSVRKSSGGAIVADGICDDGNELPLAKRARVEVTDRTAMAATHCGGTVGLRLVDAGLAMQLLPNAGPGTAAATKGDTGDAAAVCTAGTVGCNHVDVNDVAAGSGKDAVIAATADQDAIIAAAADEANAPPRLSTSAIFEAALLLSALVKMGVRTLVFGHVRKVGRIH